MMKQFKTVLDVVTMGLMIAVIGVAVWHRGARSGAGPAPVESVTGLHIPASAVSHVRGTGSVALIEVSDFECPYCGRYARDTAPLIDQEFIARGDVRQAFLNFPLPIHRQAEQAALAAECASSQGRFWDMHSALFQNQRALAREDLMATAARLHLDEAQFRSCLDDPQVAERVRRDAAEAKRLGVSATPAFFVGTVQRDGSIALTTRIDGALPFARFDEVLRDAVHRPRFAILAWLRRLA